MTLRAVELQDGFVLDLGIETSRAERLFHVFDDAGVQVPRDFVPLMTTSGATIDAGVLDSVSGATLEIGQALPVPPPPNTLLPLVDRYQVIDIPHQPNNKLLKVLYRAQVVGFSGPGDNRTRATLTSRSRDIQIPMFFALEGPLPPGVGSAYEPASPIVQSRPLVFFEREQSLTFSQFNNQPNYLASFFADVGTVYRVGSAGHPGTISADARKWGVRLTVNPGGALLRESWAAEIVQPMNDPGSPYLPIPQIPAFADITAAIVNGIPQYQVITPYNVVEA